MTNSSLAVESIFICFITEKFVWNYQVALYSQMTFWSTFHYLSFFGLTIQFIRYISLILLLVYSEVEQKDKINKFTYWVSNCFLLLKFKLFLYFCISRILEKSFTNRICQEKKYLVQNGVENTILLYIRDTYGTKIYTSIIFNLSF